MHVITATFNVPPCKKNCYSFFVSVPTSLDTQEDLNLVTGGLHGLG